VTEINSYLLATGEVDKDFLAIWRKRKVMFFIEICFFISTLWKKHFIWVWATYCYSIKCIALVKRWLPFRSF
jgi:hypothetical protein